MAFTRRSKKRKCGVADALHDEGTEVWGVVYEIPEQEIALLDKCEGFKPSRKRCENAYVRKERHVWRDGDKEKPILVQVYFANREKNPPRPNIAYKKLIVDGAKWWHLPADYIDQLETIETAD